MDINILLVRTILAVGLGALMGLERDENWRHHENAVKPGNVEHVSTESKFSFIKKNIPASSLGGLRTYTLISLLGAVAGIAYKYNMPFITGALLVSIVLFILSSYILNYFDKNTFGLTTEISIILNFTLSLLLTGTDIPMHLIIAITVFIAIILSMKQQVHLLVSKFTQNEISGMLKFILVTIVVLPFLPNVSYGFKDVPFLYKALSGTLPVDLLNTLKFFNPFNTWLVVVFISTINFVGYFLSKILGGNKGIGVTGFLGGFVSSTAVTQAMAIQSRTLKSNGAKNILIKATLYANMTQFIRILVITIFMNLKLASAVAIPMLVMTGFLIISIIIVSGKKDKETKVNDVRINFKSPFTFSPALKFGLLFMVVTAVTKFAIYYAGDSGFLITSLISAVSGMDAITITASSYGGTLVAISLCVVVLVIAACVNLIVKMMFVGISGDEYFVKKINRIFFMDLAAGLISMMIVLIR